MNLGINTDNHIDLIPTNIQYKDPITGELKFHESGDISLFNNAFHRPYAGSHATGLSLRPNWENQTMTVLTEVKFDAVSLAMGSYTPTIVGPNFNKAAPLFFEGDYKGESIQLTTEGDTIYHAITDTAMYVYRELFYPEGHELYDAIHEFTFTDSISITCELNSQNESIFLTASGNHACYVWDDGGAGTVSSSYEIPLASISEPTIIEVSGSLGEDGWWAFNQIEIYNTGCTEIISTVDETIFYQIKVGPNPANDLLYINNIPEGDFQIQLFDVKGQLVFKDLIKESGPYSIDIKTAGLTSNIYLLKLKDVHSHLEFNSKIVVASENQKK